MYRLQAGSCDIAEGRRLYTQCWYRSEPRSGERDSSLLATWGSKCSDRGHCVRCPRAVTYTSH